MGYTKTTVHVEKFPGSIDGLCGRKGYLIIRDPALHQITCSGCVNKMKKRTQESEKHLIEQYKENPDLHVDNMPEPIKVKLTYTFSFRPYDGEFAHRGTEDRWWIFQDENCIGRVTRKELEERWGGKKTGYVAYPLNTQFGKKSEHNTLLDACLALSKTPEGEQINLRDELVRNLQELNS